MMDRINERLSTFSSELRYEEIPSEVLSHLKQVMLDCYGCGLFGSTTPWMRIYREVLENRTDRQEASIWGTDRKTSVVAAMMLNGSAINSFELDDTHTDGIIHVSTGVLGCITAFAEMLGTLSGKEFLTAATLAYEVACRVAAPVGMEIAHQGWNNTGTCCPFGSTAGVGKMLGLTPEQMGHAMGIAGNWSGGLQAVQFASMAKRIVPSKTSEGAILGALLAQKGFTGIEDVFENKFGGFYNCFTDDVYDVERTSGELGSRWELLGVGLKFYSTCRSKHTTIGALRKFREDHPEIRPDDIGKVVAHTTSITHKYSVDADAITSVVAAQLSHPYVCAVTLLEGNAFIDQFTEEKIKDPKILEFAKKVEVVHDEEIEKLPRHLRYTVKVDVHLKNGKVFNLEETFPKGHPKNPFTPEELLWKFRTLAGKALPDGKQVDRIVDAVLNLEELENFNELTRLLSTRS
ncbi:MAG: MmgE/PrpD family protein [Synergistales bacterium]|jgi:aconitate decarboxylase|nr:MmgE/PrpD family protein [Synergistales bacterium]